MDEVRAREVIAAELHAAWVRRGGGGDWLVGHELIETEDFDIFPFYDEDSGAEAWRWVDKFDATGTWDVAGSHDAEPPIPDGAMSVLAGGES